MLHMRGQSSITAEATVAQSTMANVETGQDDGTCETTIVQQMSSHSSSMSSLSSSPTSTAATNSMLTTTSSCRQQKAGRDAEATDGNEVAGIGADGIDVARIKC